MDLSVVFVKDRILVSWYFLSIFRVPFRARSCVPHFLLIHFGVIPIFNEFCFVKRLSIFSLKDSFYSHTYIKYIKLITFLGAEHLYDSVFLSV